MLTEKQHALLQMINQRLGKTGIPPSYDEMRLAIGLQSKSGIHRLIVALEERGFVRRIPNRARAIEVLRLPEAAAGHETRTPPIPSPRAQEEAAGAPPPGMRLVPVMGSIAAGTPAAAIQSMTHSICVSADLLPPGEHYALEVRGDSMVDAGILDGDTVIVRRGEVARTGEVVVALIDGEEATLKRFRRRGMSVLLEPANTAYETRVFGPGRVRVQGVLAGLVRRY